jgi:hypothetical protein
MGLFGWLASHWAPTYEYRDYYANEVEYIAWESTTAGSRWGFLLGFPAGGLMALAVIGGAMMTGLYTPPFPTAASREAQRDAATAQAASEALNTLWEENQALKKQLASATVAATCPPCRPQAVTKEPPQPQAVVSTSQPAKRGMTKTAATLKTGGAAAGSEAAQPSTSQRVGTPSRVVPAPTVSAPATKPEIAPRAAPFGMAMVEVRTSQGQFVPGVPIAFRFLDGSNQQVGGATVATNPSGRATATIPAGTSCAEFHLPSEYVGAGRVKPEISAATGRPLAPGVFKTCGEILTHPNGILGVFTID